MKKLDTYSDFSHSRFTIKKKIGEGNFGYVFKASDIEKGKSVAVKISKNSAIPHLDKEIEILESLKSEQGFPTLIDHGFANEKQYIVISFHGLTLQKKLFLLRKTLDFTSLIDLSIKCLRRIRTLHNKFYIHRDLKPSQFLIDSDLNPVLIDFGLSKKYMHGKFMIHIPYSDSQPFIGTVNYASLNTHLGVSQSRRDDLESFCYILSLITTGDLPWIDKSDISGIRAVKKAKLSVSPYKLFTSLQLAQLFKYVKSLSFDQDPDYRYIFQLLKNSKEERKENCIPCAITFKDSELPTKKKKKSSKTKKFNKTQFSKSGLKRSNLCRTLNEIHYSPELSQTQYCESPEFKDKKRILGKTVAPQLKHLSAPPAKISSCEIA